MENNSRLLIYKYLFLCLFLRESGERAAGTVGANETAQM